MLSLQARHINRTILLIAFTIYAGSVNVAVACRCREPDEATAFRRADVVAEITVISSDAGKSPDSVHVHVNVLSFWKKPVADNIVVVTGDDCAYPMATGGHYVLFLSQVGKEYGTYRCRGNRLGAGVPALIKWLNHRQKQQS